MTATVAKAFLRYLVRRKALSLLQLLGIGLGVASACGMALSARAALDSFGRAVDFLTGKATHSLSRPAGPLDENLLSILMKDPAIQAFSPVIERHLEINPGTEASEFARVLGMDFFLDRELRPNLDAVKGETLTESFLFDENAALVDLNLAERLGLSVGQIFSTSVGDIKIVGTFPNSSAEPLILVDIASAQELFGMRGVVDRVDLILSDSQNFSARWKTGFTVESSQQNKATMGRMLNAFRLNIEALSLLGLFVGVFLIYNTAMFSVVSRRRDAGILLCLGAKKSEVAAAFMAELMLQGGLGGMLGGVLGYLMSLFLTEAVGGAISNIYFFLRPTPPGWSWSIAGLGLLLGLAASLVGGIFPLLEILRTDPAQTITGRIFQPSQANGAKKAALWGLAAAALGLALLPGASYKIYIGFAGAFALLLGLAMTSGLVIQYSESILTALGSAAAKLTGKAAARNIRRNLGRTSVAVAAFMVALSVSMGLGLMIGSFRETLIAWMDDQISGDVYIAPSTNIPVPREFHDQLEKIPGVAGVDAHRRVNLTYENAPIQLVAVNVPVIRKYLKYRWIDGGPKGGQGGLKAVEQGDVMVSESFARRFDKWSGDFVTLDGLTGPAKFKIAGVIYDYSTEHGIIKMDWKTYTATFGDETITNIGLFLDRQGTKNEQTIREIRELAIKWNIPVMTRSELHENVLGVFDSTFAVTKSLRILAIIIAFFGISGALLALFMERQKEFGIMRALGFSGRQVAAMTLLESLGMGGVSFLMAVPVGTILSLILIHVINIKSFHWTIFFHPMAGPYAASALTALVASLGAAAYPLWRIRRTFPSIQLREE